MANVALRIIAEARQAIGEVSHLRAVEGQLAETTAAAAKAMGEQTAAQTGVADSARAVVAEQVRQLESTRANVVQYEAMLGAVKKGSDEQVVLTRLVRTEQEKLALAYREAGVAAVTSARRSVEAQQAAAKESQFARGFLTRGVGVSSLGATPFLVGAVAGVEAKRAISDAIDLQAEIVKTRIAFGQSAGGVLAWSATTDRALGLARGETLKTADAFEVLFRNMGLAPQQATALSRSLTELAPKLALFARTDVDTAASALQQGLAGRARALRQYGIFIDQTTIKAEALRLGLVKSAVDSGKVEEAQTKLNIAVAKAAEAERDYGAGTTQAAAANLAVKKAHDALAKAVSGTTGQLSTAAKAQAAYSLIERQSLPAQEAFAKNQGSQAQQSRILRAEIRNLEEDIGTDLLPTVREITHALVAWLSQSRNQETVQRDVKAAVEGVTGAVRTSAAAIHAVDRATGSLKNTVELLLALKVVSTLAKWTVAEQAFGAGAVTANSEVGALRLGLTRLSLLRLAAIPIVIKLIDDATGKKITNLNSWIYNHITGPITGALHLPGGGGHVGGPSAAVPVRPPAGAGGPVGSVYPVSGGITRGRIDRGVDFAGQGYVFAIDDGVVTYVGFERSNVHGGGGPFVIYEIAGPRWVYVAEQWTPTVRVGQHLVRGQRLGRVHGHIEIGWAAGPTGTWNTQAKGAKEGEVTPAGRDFATEIGVGGTTRRQPGRRAPGGGAPSAAPTGGGGGRLRVGTKAKGAAPGLAIVPGKLTSEQERVARLIYQTALARGATPVEALAMVAAAYAESKLNPRALGGGLFQINAAGNPKVYARYMQLLRAGYDPTTAAVMAMVATYIEVGKEHPGAGAAEIAALAERPSLAAVRRAGYKSTAAFEGQALGSIFGFGSSAGYGGAQTGAARKAAVERIRRQLPAELAQLDKLVEDGILTPETGAVIHARVRALRKLIADALKDGIVTKAELSAIKSKWAQLASTLKAGLEAAIREAETARIVKKLIGDALRDGLITDAEVDLIDSKMSNLRGKLAAHLKALVKTIHDSRGELDDAWGRLRDTLLSAFDEQVVNRVAGLRSFGASALTRAQTVKAGERAQGKIASLESGGIDPVMATIKQKGDELVEAYRAFNSSMRGAGVTSGTSLGADQDKVVQAAQRLAEAQDQWDGLAGEWTDTETAYHDAYQRLIDSAAAEASDALDQYQQQQEAQAQLARKALEPKLNAVYADLRAGKITLQQAEQRINDLLAPFGLSLADLGNMLDNSDLTDALADLKSAVDELTKAIKGLGGLAPQPVAPRPRQPVGDDTTRGYAGYSAAVGAGRGDVMVRTPAGVGASPYATPTVAAAPNVTFQIVLPSGLMIGEPEKLVEPLVRVLRDPMASAFASLGERNGGRVPGWPGRVTS